MATVLSGAQVSPSGYPGPSSTGIPVGSILDFAGSVEPSGWLFCFGQSLARAGTYAALFAVIGTTYGSVDGSSFSLPDLRGRVIAGKDNMGGTSANRLTIPLDGDVLGATGGTEEHTLGLTEIPSHTHSYIQGLVAFTGLASGTIYNTNNTNNNQTTTAAGGGLAHNNTQPTMILSKIIKY
jgi:microcystin-dependent protein